ncbi:MAG: dUTP diphosphatase [Clostridia bacterium]|nr:dUTP diphosphatase [Deltaproteobacteria bacterium]
MSNVTVLIQPLHPKLGCEVPLPVRMTPAAAGLDIAAAVDAPVTLAPGDRALIPCGFAMAIPDGFEAQMRPRSGLAAKFGVTLLNSPGTIDADYRGEVKVVLINHGREPFVVETGMRIAQMVVAPVTMSAIEVVTSVTATERGTRGFGSTGH